MTIITADQIAERLQAIAKAIRDQLQQQVTAKINLENLKDARANRKDSIAPPPDGWPGKNADERAAAHLAACKLDLEWAKYNSAIKMAEENVAQIATAITILTEERRGLEWTISAIQAEAMQGKRQDHEHRRQNITQVWSDEAEVDELPF